MGRKLKSANVVSWIIRVIQKYVAVEQDQVSVQLDNSDNCSVLELNVTLPR